MITQVGTVILLAISTIGPESMHAWYACNLKPIVASPWTASALLHNNTFRAYVGLRESDDFQHQSQRQRIWRENSCVGGVHRGTSPSVSMCTCRCLAQTAFAPLEQWVVESAMAASSAVMIVASH